MKSSAKPGRVPAPADPSAGSVAVVDGDAVGNTPPGKATTSEEAVQQPPAKKRSSKKRASNDVVTEGTADAAATAVPEKKRAPAKTPRPRKPVEQAPAEQAPAAPARTAATSLSDTAAEQPELAAFLLAEGWWGERAETYRPLTYGELDRRSDAVAAGLTAFGIGPGVRTAMLVPVGEEFFVLMFALIKARAVPVLVDPGLGRANLKDCLDEARPTAFIGVRRAHLARKLLHWAPEATLLVTTGGVRKGLLGGRPLQEIEQAGADLLAARAEGSAPAATGGGSEDDLAAIAFTSGSTGIPKGVEYRTRHLLAQAELLRNLYDIEPGSVSLATFPPFALLGPALGLTTLLPYMDFTRPAAVDSRRLFAAVNDYQATLMFGSPALLEALSRWGSRHRATMPTMRRVVSAGAPVSRSVQRRLLPMLHAEAQVFSPYGATEALPVTSIGSTEVLTLRQLGICVGRPIPGVEAAIVPLVDGPMPDLPEDCELPVGEIGEIVVRGPNVTESYAGRPEATARARVRWGGTLAHRMGDAAYRDAEGRLWFCGRVAHRVTTERGVLYSVPCEEVLNASLDVYRSALVGVGPAGAQRPVFCVELERPSEESPELLARLRALAAANPLTADIDTVLFHPGFPVDIRHNSKIRREELAEWATRRLA